MGPHARFCYLFEYVLQIDLEDFIANTGLTYDDLLDIATTEDPKAKLPEKVVHHIVKTYPFICYDWLRNGSCRFPRKNNRAHPLLCRRGKTL